MTAAQVREAARLLDVVHAPDDEIVDLETRGTEGVLLSIGPRSLYERAKPVSLLPRLHLIARDGTSAVEAPRR